MRGFVTHGSPACAIDQTGGGDGEQVPVEVLDRRTVPMDLHSDEDFLNQIVDLVRGDMF